MCVGVHLGFFFCIFSFFYFQISDGTYLYISSKPKFLLKEYLLKALMM